MLLSDIMASFLERPPKCAAAVQEKYLDTIKYGNWVMDSASNYIFGEFGSGKEAVIEAIDRAVQKEKNNELSILDVGAGSGEFLSVTADIIENDGRIDKFCNVFVIGLTGGPEIPVASNIVPVSKDITNNTKIGPHSNNKMNIGLLQQFSSEEIELSRTIPNFKPWLNDNQDKPRLFDLIVLSWTLRHFCEPLGSLERLTALLKPGGVLLGNGWRQGVTDDLGTINGFIEAVEAAEPACDKQNFETLLDVKGTRMDYDENDEQFGGYSINVKITREAGIFDHYNSPCAGIRFPVSLKEDRVIGPLGGPSSGSVLKGGGQYLMCCYSLL